MADRLRHSGRRSNVALRAERSLRTIPVVLMSVASVLVSILCVPTRNAAAQDDSPQTIVIFQIEGPDSNERLRNRLTSVLRAEAERSDDYQLANDDPAVLSEVVVVLGCGEISTSCLEKAAERYDAQRLLHSDLQETDGQTNVRLRLFDPDEGRQVASVDHGLADASEPYDDFRRKVDDLLGIEPLPPDNTLNVRANVDGATVELDGERVGETPVETKDLEPGSHQIRVEAEGYEPWSTQIDIKRRDSVDIRASLNKRETEPTGPRADSSPESSSEADTTSEGETGAETTTAAPSSPTSPVAADPSSQSWVVQWGPWLSVGVGALSLGGAGVAALQIDRAEDDLARWREDNGDNTEIGETAAERAILRRGENAQRTHRILLGIGGITVTGGLLWLWFRNIETNESTVSASPPLRVVLSPRRLSLGWRW